MTPYDVWDSIGSVSVCVVGGEVGLVFIVVLKALKRGFSLENKTDGRKKPNRID